MIYTGYELLWLFLIYSFLGWIMETVTAAVKQKTFVNRGLINAPFCVLYGFAAVIITVFSGELRGFWFFADAIILSTLLEWMAGHLIERMFHERWWDYSEKRWNFDGYICLQVSLLWGILAVIMREWGNPLFLYIFRMMPEMAGILIVSVFAVLLAVDMVSTLIIMNGRSKRMQQWEAVDEWLSGISSGLGRRIYSQVDMRIRKAYPQRVFQREKTETPAVFACGCGFHKIVWLLVIGAFLGDIVETVFCRLKMGIWMSRSSVVWGPFSLVWGIAIAAATLLLYKYKDKSEAFLFVIGTFLGGAYEYFCSVFTEIVFGTVFWDYSEIPFNLGGRINLLYCFFWGIAAVVWMKLFYPKVSAWIEKVPERMGKAITWILVVFMSCNIVVSCMALMRSGQRADGIPAESAWQKMMDERFDDERMHRIYPNAIDVEEDT